MKKILGLAVVFAFVVAGASFAQKANGQELSIWERLMGPNQELGSIQNAAQVISATNAVKVDIESPSQVSGGCGNTLTPTGKINETLRCDGRSWVAAKNLLNDGTRVGIGTVPGDAKLRVSTVSGTGLYVTTDRAGEYAAISASSGDWNGGGLAINGDGMGPGGIGVRGRGSAVNGIGVYGTGNVGTGVMGATETGIAVHAWVPDNMSGQGFVQEGANIKNNFEGEVSIHYTVPPQSVVGVPLQVDGGVKILPSRAQNPCTATLRGTFWFTTGDPGVADSAEVCAKNADGSYAWKNLF